MLAGFVRDARNARARAQNVVEFGLSVAAVAFVALIGFHALGAAQAAYWGATSPTLAAPTPPPTAFVHPTKILVTPAPNCDPARVPVWHTGDTLQCNASVVDWYQTDKHAPHGTLTMQIDGVDIGSCTLVPNEPTASSTCAAALTYQWKTADAGQHAVTFVYTADNTSNHSNFGPTAPPLVFTVTVPLQFTFQCFDPWSANTFKVEVGQPLICGLMVIDQSTGVGPAQPVTVNVSAQSGAGNWSIACFSNDPKPWVTATDTDGKTPLPGDPFWALHDQAHAVLVSAGCAPVPNTQFTCTTQPNGLCANTAAAALPRSAYCAYAAGCSFVYRRGKDDAGGVLGADALTAWAPSVGEGATSPQITLSSDTMNTPTAAVLNCTPGSGSTTPGTLNFGRSQGISTTSSINTTAGSQITCGVSVVDIGTNTAFDYSTCIPPVDVHCSFDAQQANAPLGPVTVWLLDSGKNATGVSFTCNLAHSMPTPGNIASLHPFGAWFHASWCGGTFNNMQSGTWYISPQYGGTAAHAATGANGGPQPLLAAITVP